jgi:uncharacterized protein (DUF1015 family)
MKIRAFHGLRFDGTADQAGALAAPPYDQINDSLRDELHAWQHHFSHLTRPVARGDASGHENSHRLHENWLAQGVTVRDAHPTLYANSIETPSGEVSLGLTALIDLEPASSGVIRPHEETVDKTVEERLDLLLTTQVDYEPILVLADDNGTLGPLLREDCGGEALAVHLDDFGNRHRLFRIAGPDRLRHYKEALAGAYGLIADGHHRYKTARLHAAQIDAARGTAAGAKLGVITSLSSSTLSIAPIHRALTTAHDGSTLAAVARGRELWNGESGAELAHAVTACDQPALAILDPDGTAVIWQLDPSHGPTDLPPAASELTVVLLHRTLFPRWGLTAENATDGTVKYRSDPDALFAAVTSGSFATGVFLPPMTPTGFAAAVADGDVLPPKSTRFLPKVVSGLVWAAHEDPVE